MASDSGSTPASIGADRPDAAVPDQTTPFRCRGCEQPLTLVDGNDGVLCATCGWRAGDHDRVLDFVADGEKRDETEYYDARYTDPGTVAPADVRSLAQLWTANPYAPYNQTVWRQMQDIEGKLVVVLGSGAAPRELAFLDLAPAGLVISDLSRAPLRALRDTYLRQHQERTHFAAIDAEDLPFADEAIDVLYGYLFVHHLPHLDRFLTEAARVLRPGGRAVFVDAAYAPAWEWAKRTWLRWLMRLAHRVNPISPEDLRFTLAGGFRPDDLERRIRAVGGIPWLERSGALHYMAVRGSEILARVNSAFSLGGRDWVAQPPGVDPPYALVWRRRWLLEVLLGIDQALSRRSARFAGNQVRLAWGFDKPGLAP